MKIKLILLLTFISTFFCNIYAKNKPMFDSNKVDDPTKTWCYSPKSTTVIGVPFVSTPVQVTFDGAIYTGSAELCFFYGKDLKPVMARQKNFLDGWMPIVEYSWKAEGINYHLEIFSTIVKPLDNKNTVQFAKLTMKNCGDIEKTGQFAAAFRGNGMDHRKRRKFWKPILKKTSTISIKQQQVFCDKKMIYTFDPKAELQIVVGTKYNGQYKVKDFYLSDRTATAFTIYKRSLKPNEEFSATFKMAHKPRKEQKTNEKIVKADYERYRASTIKYWQDLITKRVSFSIPEKRVNDSARAALVHLVLATRSRGRGRRQGSGLPYDGLFLNDYVDMRLAYDVYGLTEFVDVNVPWLIKQQLENGMFLDVSLSHNKKILASHGQALFSVANHYIMTNDEEYIKKVYLLIKKGTDWIVNQHQKNKNGLLQPSIPYDNEMIKGCYTSHNLWALLGLRNAIRVAKRLGKNEDAKRWIACEKSYKKSILKAIDLTIKEHGYIAPGLLKYITGVKARRGFAEYRTSQDWENNLLVYPTETLDANDPRVFTTLEHIRKQKYREGCMTYRNGQHIHQYITLNQANQYAAIGKQKQAIIDLYHVLLHNGSTHEGFENLVEPWTNRDPCPSCPPPHAWAAAKTALFIRNALVREYGGEAGMDENKRGLFLYSLISPIWAMPDKEIKINNACTEMGRISSTLKFSKTGAIITIDGNFTQKPAFLAFRIPYFVTLQNYNVEGGKATIKDGVIYADASVTKIVLDWQKKKNANNNIYQDLLKSYRSEYGFIKKPNGYTPENKGKPFLTAQEKQYPSTPLSFNLVKNTFLHEYKRRYQLYLKAGKKPWKIAPPSRLTAKQRKTIFNTKQKKRK